MTKKNWKAPQLRLEESGSELWKEKLESREWAKRPSVGTRLQENDEMQWKHNSGNGAQGVKRRQSQPSYHILRKPTDNDKRRIREMTDWIMAMSQGDINVSKTMLKHYTTFTNKKGDVIEGKTSTKDLSSNQIKTIYPTR